MVDNVADVLSTILEIRLGDLFLIPITFLDAADTVF
jgi:hypothetical protein